MLRSRILIVLGLLAPGLLSIVAAVDAVADTGALDIPRGKGDACVAETDYMRRYHMDLILHQRDETVIKGIRDEPFSLVECVNCHAGNDTQGQAVRIDEEGQFCQVCHQYAAVRIDCFGCHRATPDEQLGELGLLPHTPRSLASLTEQVRYHLDHYIAPVAGSAKQ